MNLVDLLRSRAERNPHKSFLFFEDNELTFAGLEARTAALAAGLQRLGVVRGDRVAVLLPNGPAFVESFLGIPRLGAICAPLNTHLKSDELDRLLSHCGARVLITDSVRATRLEPIRDALKIERLIVIGPDVPAGALPYAELFDAGQAAPGVAFDDSTPAALIYTMAAANNTRGVLLSHGNYAINAAQSARAVQMSADDRLLCVLPLYNVNAQVVTLLAPLYAGASAALLPKFSPRTFLPTISRLRITAFSGVPTIYAILNRLPDSKRYDLSSLRYCICGSAPLPVAVFNSFENKYRATILEGYGLSEATCTASVNPLDLQRKVGSIGLSVPDQQMIVADSAGRPLPDGRTGEILIKGPNVMLGYYNDTQATAESIVDGWLRTGDLGYRDSEGFFFIVGRRRELIIRGGQNIFPGEIEEALLLDENVADAAAIGAPDEIYGEQVVAFVKLKPQAIADAQAVIERCASRLAEYKCPSHVLFVDELPRDPAGRPDKQRLLELLLDSYPIEARGE